jgi:4-amino-4-deoxy-L-arabinose transferase-like glycosyltransferase
MSVAARLFKSDRACVVLLLFLGLVLFSTQLGGHDLWAPDEPDIGEVVREIHLTGNWQVLHDNGELYFEKPPLYPWLAALFAVPAGRPTEFTLRLPSSLAALLGLIVLFHLGRGLFGRRTGTLAAVILATTYGYFMEARWAHPDMLWTFWLLLSALAFHRAHEQAGAVEWLAVFYLCLGFANLTKGPHGLLIPLLAVTVFLASTRELGFLRRMGLWWGIPLSLLPAGFWVVAYQSTGERFPLEALLLRLGHRFTSGEHHAQPFYHVFASLPAEFFPWVLFLPFALWHTFPRRGGRPDKDNAYLYSWVIVIFTVFAASVEKRGVYLLPLLPFLALVVARTWDLALMGWDPSPVDRPITWALGAALLLAAGGAAVVLPRVAREAPGLLAPAAGLAGACVVTAVAAFVVHRRFGGGAALGAFAAGLTAVYLTIAIQVMPAMDSYKSAREFCRRVVAAVGGAPLAMYPDYRPTYVYYTERFIPVLKTREELRRHLDSDRRSFCLIEDRVLAAEKWGLNAQTEIVDRQRVGHREMLLVASGSKDEPEGPEGQKP